MPPSNILKEITADRAWQLFYTARAESEFGAGHIDNAILLPRGTIEFKINALPELADKSKAVLIYCRTGGRCALAAQILQKIGYTNVLSLAGGFEGWK